MIELWPITNYEASLIAKWRNDPKVSLSLRTWKLTDTENQGDWIKKISQDNSVVYFSIHKIKKNGSEFVGYCGLDKIDSVNRRAEISLLINPSLHKKGLGKISVYKLLDFAFNSLGLQTVYGEVYQTTSALSFWLKCGFSDCGQIPGAKYHNRKYYPSNIIVISRSQYDKLDR